LLAVQPTDTFAEPAAIAVCVRRVIAFLLPAVQIRTLHGLRHAAAASDVAVVICLLFILFQLATSPVPVRPPHPATCQNLSCRSNS
jgi:hypothetical protein